jgi:hypothetical protein
MHPTRRQSRWTRWSHHRVTRSLALLVVGVQLLGVAHLALERHGVCWEHGTVTELQPGVPSAPVAVPAGRDAELRAGHASGRVEDVDGHHHCPVQASRRDWASPPAPVLVSLPAAPDQVRLALAERSTRGDGALLLRAPKQSPPPAV